MIDILAVFIALYFLFVKIRENTETGQNMKNNNASKKMSLLGFAAIAITVGATLGSAHANEQEGQMRGIPETNRVYVADNVKACIQDFNLNMQKVLDLTILSITQQKEFNAFAKMVGREEAYQVALSDKTDFSDGMEAMSITRKFDRMVLDSETNKIFMQKGQEDALLTLCEKPSFQNKVKKSTELLENSADIKTASVLKFK